MSNYLFIPLICWAAVTVIMALVWLWALKLKNNGIVDVFWAFNFTVIAALTWYLADGFEERKNLVCALAGLWSIRLGIYLSIRIFSHLHEEEGRYKKLREEWSDGKFFFFFQMQAFSNVMLSIPFFIIALNKESQLSTLEYIGAALWLI